MTERRSIRALVAAALAGAILTLARSLPPARPHKHRSWIRNERTGGEVLFSQDVIEGGYGHPSGWYEWGSRLIHP
jgi:hypothetical protein